MILPRAILSEASLLITYFSLLKSNKANDADSGACKIKTCPGKSPSNLTIYLQNSPIDVKDMHINDQSVQFLMWIHPSPCNISRATKSQIALSRIQLCPFGTRTLFEVGKRVHANCPWVGNPFSIKTKLMYKSEIILEIWVTFQK